MNNYCLVAFTPVVMKWLEWLLLATFGSQLTSVCVHSSMHTGRTSLCLSSTLLSCVSLLFLDSDSVFLMLDFLTGRPSSTIKLKASSPQGCVWWPLLYILLMWLLSKVSLISTYRKEVATSHGPQIQPVLWRKLTMTVFHEEAEVADLGVLCSGGECSDFFYNCLLRQLLWGWQDSAAKMVKSAQKTTNSSFPSLEHIYIKRCRIGYWTSTASI